jgi:hypothetical protein
MVSPRRHLKEYVSQMLVLSILQWHHPGLQSSKLRGCNLPLAEIIEFECQIGLLCELGCLRDTHSQVVGGGG